MESNIVTMARKRARRRPKEETQGGEEGGEQVTVLGPALGQEVGGYVAYITGKRSTSIRSDTTFWDKPISIVES